MAREFTEFPRAETMKLPPLRGIVPPLPTPLTEDEGIDLGALSRLVEAHVRAGVHALWIMGTTARFDLIPDARRRQAAEAAARAAGGRVPMVLNVSDMGTRRTLDFARACDDLPYDYYAALPPWYLPMAPGEVADYFLALADNLARPLVIYNAPWINNQIDFAAVRRLAEHPRIVGVKDVGAGLGRPLDFPAAERERLGFSYLHGNDFVAIGTALEADGYVSALADAFPEVAVAAWDATLAGDEARAFRLQTQFLRLARAMTLGPTLACLEAACRHRGFLDRMLPKPLRSLTPEVAREVVAAIEAAGILPAA